MCGQLIFLGSYHPVRDMNWEHLPKTVTRMDAGVEPPWKVLRRVLGRCSQFMSLVVNGTAVKKCIPSHIYKPAKSLHKEVKNLRLEKEILS